MPAGPNSVTSCGRLPETTRSQIPSSVSSSDVRPSIGAAAAAPAPRSARGPIARQTGMGCCLPFARTGSSCSYTIDVRVAWYVSSPTRTPFTGAADCSRAAVFTTSPATSPSPCAGFADTETSASPVLTAMRTSRSTRSRIASAARTARSGSSPCATGAPKTAITASPMYFSTVPPNASIADRTRAKYGAWIARTSSGSSCSDRAVNPTRSTKRTVTTLRSSASTGAEPGSAAAHELQKRAPAGFSCPQLGQICMREA